MIMNNTLIDNSTENLLMRNTLRACLTSQEYDIVRIATGYWDIPGLALLADEIRTFLEKDGTKLQLLLGKDPYVYESQLATAKYKGMNYPKDFIRIDLNELEPKPEYENAVRLLLDYCTEGDDSKIEIRVYRKNEDDETQFLHSKCYIFTGNTAIGIVGSSNFTQKGLEGNAELNYVETNWHQVTSKDTSNPSQKSFVVWFEEKWNDSEPWNKEFLLEVLRPSPIAKRIQPQGDLLQPEQQSIEPLTPYEVYIKYLQQYFGDIADGTMDKLLEHYIQDKYTRLSFQFDAVKQGFSIMKRYGGFILADVVGLGKTITALLLIRLYIEHSTRLGRSEQVLIVTPPAIKRGWMEAIEKFDEDQSFKLASCIDFITTGSIGKLGGEEIEEDGEEFASKIVFKEYGMVVIDESHNFRNSGTQKYHDLDDLIGSIMPTPYVCLLSATPQNNSPADLYNQIRLFQRNTLNCTLPNVPNGQLAKFFDNMKKRFAEARNLPADTEENKKKAADIIAEVSRDIRQCVLNDIVVRRTRTDIKKHYPQDSSTLQFPTIQGPKALEYKMDAKLAQLFADTVEAIDPARNSSSQPSGNVIQFHRYTAIAQFKDKKFEKLYERRNLTVEAISQRLAKMMRNMLVKRLESSLSAFKVSLNNLLADTELMIEMFDHNMVFICPDIDLSKIYEDCGKQFDVFQRKVNELVKKKPDRNRCFTSADFQDSYLSDLKADQYVIRSLVERWNLNDFDPKLYTFVTSISKLFDPAINCPKSGKPKLVIFTEALATQEAIVRALEDAGHRVLQISAKNRDDMSETIATNFDANRDVEEQRDDFDVIVTTEVLAEGVNLHRANVILNYDTPWNSTRLMQRIGRVNRIGSTEDDVHVFNFFPSAEGNREIKLIEKAFAKLQSFHELFGEDSKVFSDREQVREHELIAMTDGEESPFSRHVAALKEYSQQHSDRYKVIVARNFSQLGGILQNNPQQALCVFSDNSGAMVSVRIDDIAAPKAQIISPLATMESLECDLAAEYVTDDVPANYELLKLAMQNAYINHSEHLMGSGNRGNQRPKALQILAQWRQKPTLTDETRAIINQVDQYVRNGNRTVIAHVLRCNENITTNPSLFGDDFDINGWMRSAFGRLAASAVQQRGEATIAIEQFM